MARRRSGTAKRRKTATRPPETRPGPAHGSDGSALARADRLRGAVARLPAWSRRPWAGLAAVVVLTTLVVGIGWWRDDGNRPLSGRTDIVSVSPATQTLERVRKPGDPPPVPLEPGLRADHAAPPAPVPVPPAMPVPEPSPPVPPAAEVAVPPVGSSGTAPATPAAPAVRPVPPRTVALPPLPPAPEGVPAWRHFAVAAPSPVGKARVVVVIDDMGLDRPRSSRVVALPGPLTLAWLPYGLNLQSQTAAARAAGHELIVHVPMEPEGSKDPGPNAMLTRLDAAELKRRLAANLSAFDGFVGINNHMGSRFTGHQAGMAVVMAELAGRGLLFLDSRTTADSKGPELAVHYRVPSAQRDVFLDNALSGPAVEAALRKVEEIALRNGVAIAIGHPHDVTTQALKRWLPTLAGKGLQLVPLSSVVKSPAPRAAGASGS